MLFLEFEWATSEEWKKGEGLNGQNGKDMGGYGPS